MSISLDENYKLDEVFNPKKYFLLDNLVEYIGEVSKLNSEDPKAYLSLLDLWTYSNGFIFENSRGSSFEDLENYLKMYSDKLYDQSDEEKPKPKISPIEAFKTCIQDKNHNSCNLVENFTKAMGNKTNYVWKMVRENLYDDLVPLCSYATTNLTLKNCTEIKRIDHEQCFTFNETSFVQRLGQTQGFNLLVNFDYPGTINDMSNPVTIALHQQNQNPDLRNIKGGNFEVHPGRRLDLKIATTVVDATENFEAMDFDSRLCNRNLGYGEVNCLMKKITEGAKSDCHCQPWYTNVTNTRVRPVKYRF